MTIRKIHSHLGSKRTSCFGEPIASNSAYSVIAMRARTSINRSMRLSVRPLPDESKVKTYSCAMTEESLTETVATDQDSPSGSFGVRHPFVVYTGLRILLLLATGIVCYLLGARGIGLIILAFLISGLISFIVLVPQRDRVGTRVGGYFRRLNDRIEESKQSEDAVVDDFHQARTVDISEDEQSSAVQQRQ